MQSTPAPSPWPKRILISGLGCTFLGIVLLFMFSGEFGSHFDPRENSEHTAEFGEVNTFELTKGCWVVSVEGDSSQYDVSYRYIEDGEEGEAISDDCSTDFQPQTGDGTDFDVLTELDINEKSKILVTITCQEEGECDEPLMFTDGNKAMHDLLLEPSFIPIMLICGVGFIFIPLGWLLIAINRGRNPGVHITQSQTTAILNPPNQNMSQDEEILTTDELYKLVRGELPISAEENKDIPGPFADADTRIRKSATTKVGGSINRASVHTPENPPTDDSWKNWDEA